MNKNAGIVNKKQQLNGVTHEGYSNINVTPAGDDFRTRNGSGNRVKNSGMGLLKNTAPTLHSHENMEYLSRQYRRH